MMMSDDATTLAHMYQTMYYTKKGVEEFRTCLPKAKTFFSITEPRNGKDRKSKCTMARTGRKGVDAVYAIIGRHVGIINRV